MKVQLSVTCRVSCLPNNHFVRRYRPFLIDLPLQRVNCKVLWIQIEMISHALVAMGSRP